MDHDFYTVFTMGLSIGCLQCIFFVCNYIL